MLIHEITKGDGLKVLKNIRLGRLACAKGAQPYITPFYFVFSGNYLYSFSTVGHRIDWMRENPLVCVETDEVVSPEEWLSIIIFGRYEELPDTLEWERERAIAHELLQHNKAWWEPGYAKTIIDGTERPLIPVYFRIEILEVTGHRAAPDRAA
jgi:nitroimidazol reductase NimA-like FMN-containing flavoprotein (pyridoxamine 5'-phosphate oxidase superfamily)